MKRYFYITVHFLPEYEKTIFLKYQDDLYRNTETGEIYRKRLLYDFGWGQEYGFELLPQLAFPDLIKLVECPMGFSSGKKLQKYTKEQIKQADIWKSNLYGAVAVIMQDHVGELLDFLSEKTGTTYFSNPDIRKNFRCFSFDSQRERAEGKIPGGVLNQSYEDILESYPEWKKISSRVIDQVYR